MFKSLTGPMMLVFKDPGSLTAVSICIHKTENS